MKVRLNTITKGASVAVGAIGVWSLLRRVRTRSLRGQVVLLAGGARGLGFSLAREFARRGCTIVICARDQAELDRARTDLEWRGAIVMARKCTLSSSADCDSLLAEVIRRFGRIDIVVNDGGVIRTDSAPSPANLPINLPTNLPAVSQQEPERTSAPVATLDPWLAWSRESWNGFPVVAAALPHMRSVRAGRVVHVATFDGEASTPEGHAAATASWLRLAPRLTTSLETDGIEITGVLPRFPPATAGMARRSARASGPGLGATDRHPKATAPVEALSSPVNEGAQAARKIVTAVEHGARVVVIGAARRATSGLSHLLPNLFKRLATAVGRWMPTQRLLPPRLARRRPMKATKVANPSIAAAADGGAPPDVAGQLTAYGRRRRQTVVLRAPAAPHDRAPALPLSPTPPRGHGDVL